MMGESPNLRYENCDISPDAKIIGEDITIGEGVCIEAGVKIEAEKISIGPGSKIERDTTIRSLSGVMKEFTLGDQSLIGFSNQIMAPVFSMGDYSQMFNSCLCSGYKPLLIGHNCWIGQDTILNCAESLTIGNNVRIGPITRLWTHIASGEVLEGCTMLDYQPIVVKDNVWFVGGGAVIAPGVTLNKNSIIMGFAAITKSTEAFHTYSGIPARDITDKLRFWKDVNLDDKFQMIREFVEEFLEQFPQHRDAIHIFDKIPENSLQSHCGNLVITSNFTDWRTAGEFEVSVFDLSTKKYLKQRSKVEIDWIRWSVGHRARFIPHRQI